MGPPTAEWMLSAATATLPHLSTGPTAHPKPSVLPQLTQYVPRFQHSTAVSQPPAHLHMVLPVVAVHQYPTPSQCQLNRVITPVLVLQWPAEAMRYLTFAVRCLPFSGVRSWSPGFPALSLQPDLLGQGDFQSSVPGPRFSIFMKCLAK